MRYGGIDREALRPTGMKGPFFDKDYTAGEIRLTELMGDWRNWHYWELVPTHEQALDVLAWENEETPGTHEIAWARRAHANDSPPPEFVCLGFEPTYFTGDHFSPICDSMCIPRWHGTDPEGVVFRDFFERLNVNGLFESQLLAAEFLAYYLSFDWTEHGGDYDIASVWAPNS